LDGGLRAAAKKHEPFKSYGERKMAATAGKVKRKERVITRGDGHAV
jgi:hypothetical protein